MIKIGAGTGTVLALAGSLAATPACAKVDISADEVRPALIAIAPLDQNAVTAPPPAPVLLPAATRETFDGIEPITWNLSDLSNGEDVPATSAEIAAIAAAARTGDEQGGAAIDGAGLADGGFGGGGLQDVEGSSVAGPPDAFKRRWSDHFPRDDYRGFGKKFRTVRTEALIGLGYFALVSSHKFFEDTAPFHFKNEGWFGKDTDNIGVDKLTHAFDTYLLAEVFHSLIHRRTDAAEGDAVTGAIIASGLMAINEISDAIEPDSGYSLQDVAMNIAGATLSVLRNTVPGMKEKFSFKVEIVPNDKVYSIAGKPHYAQQRYMFSLKGAGFEKLRNTPLRYLDLQVGYFASDFLNEDRAAGIEPKRHVFLGVGLNLGELLFGRSKSGLGKAAYTVLDYFQVPYTSVRYDTAGDWSF